VSDRAPASFRVFRVRGKERDVAGLLVQHGFGKAWSNYTVEVEDVVEGGHFFHAEANLTILGELGDALAAVGICYSGCQDACYEYPGEVHRFTPELGLFKSVASSDGEVLVSGADLDEAVVSAGDDLATLKAAIESATGKSWSDALAAERVGGDIADQVYRVFRAEGIGIDDAEAAARCVSGGTTPEVGLGAGGESLSTVLAMTERFESKAGVAGSSTVQA
jgi:hypothetical protein